MTLESMTADGRPDIILDLDRLRNNCNGNYGIVRELLAHLHQISGPKWIANLMREIDAGNSEALLEICHGMKGACATIFAWRISNLAFEFECLARDGKVEQLKCRMPELQAVFDEFELWVQKNPELS